MKYRKGKSDGAQVASFLVIIALFIIAYILLISGEERKELLGLDNDDKTDFDYTKEDNFYLLSTSPGAVSPYEKDKFEVELNDIRLFSKLESETINLIDNVKVSKSLLNEKSKTLYFKLDSLSDLRNLNLFFFVKEGSGKLYIEFNGHGIFEGDVDSGDIPIDLPVNYAKESNELKIGVINSGLFGNSYSLSSVYVKKVFDRQRKKTTRLFKLSSAEKAGLKDKSQLEYYINCLNLGEIQGVLTIMLNDRMLSKENIICGTGIQTKKIDEHSLKSGTNVLSFEIDRGDYSIEGIKINIETSEQRYPEYNFEIDDEQYEDIKECEDGSCMDDCKKNCRDDCDGADDYTDCRDACYEYCEDECDVLCDKHLILELKFKNDEDKKEATITVNKKRFSFNTKKDSYSRDISEYINRGSNYIKIIPKVGFEIDSLYVYIE
jgi:hypothetical protein